MDFTHAIELIEKNRHIGIVLSSEPAHDVCAATEALMQFLSDRNTEVGLVTPLNKNVFARTDAPNTINAFAMLTGSAPLAKEFIISLDSTVSPVSQLRYEHHNNRIDIIISPKSGPITQSSVSFRDGNVQCDCVIALGVPDIEAVDTFTSDIPPSFFTELPIINIDVSEKNKKYGEVNILNNVGSSLSELVFRFCSAFSKSSITPRITTMLLSGILHHTNAFRRLSGADSHALLVSHELLSMGADYQTAYALAHPSTPPSLMPLVGRALARSKIDQNRGILWSLLTPEDFMSTQQSVADLSLVLAHVQKQFPPHLISALLWQEFNYDGIRARLSGEREVLERVQQRTGAQFGSPHLELPDTYHTFSQAEENIRALLDQIL